MIEMTASVSSVLTLVVKGKFFDMINSGVKLEEYRDIKPHYII